MYILMTERNTGRTWIIDEVRQICGHLRTLVRLILILLLFLLPGGFLLLPAVSGVLDRRQASRGVSLFDAFGARRESDRGASPLTRGAG
jgi:hypothetical protein